MNGEFRASRVLKHSPERVYAAFADAGRLARWWGPDGFTNEFESFDFRPGGRWVFKMVGPKGERFPNQSVFEELVPASRIVIRHACPPFYRLTITLSEKDGGTLIEWRQVFDDPAVGERIRHIVVPANEQNLDRLQAVLAG